MIFWVRPRQFESGCCRSFFLIFFFTKVIERIRHTFRHLDYFFIIVLTFSAGEKGRLSYFIGVHCDASTGTPVALLDPGHLVINRIISGNIIKDRGRRLASSRCQEPAALREQKALT